jgi:hypothetical protein
VYALSKELSRKLHRWDSDWVVNLANRAGIKRIFSSSAAIPPMSEQTRCYLKEIYAAEVCELEALLSVDLARWK